MPSVFVCHASEELATICTFFPNYFRSFNQGWIIDQCCSPFSTRCVVFGFMEAETTEMADCTERPAFVGRHRGVGGILNNI